MKTKITAFLAMVMLLSLFASIPAFAGTINYTYDNAGRLTGTDYGGSKTIAFTYCLTRGYFPSKSHFTFPTGCSV